MTCENLRFYPYSPPGIAQPEGFFNVVRMIAYLLWFTSYTLPSSRFKLCKLPIDS